MTAVIKHSNQDSLQKLELPRGQRVLDSRKKGAVRNNWQRNQKLRAQISKHKQEVERVNLKWC